VTAAESAVEAVYRQMVAPLLPAGQPIWDVHAHVGSDRDGSALTPDVLVAELAGHGVARAFAFPFCAPAVEDYPRLNDEVIAWCGASGGVLVPFCRVEPAPGARAELERALDAGARGIKLHPARGHFPHTDPVVETALAIADERGVPVLVHAGRGLPPLAAHLAPLAERYPGAQVILAHAAVADMRALAGPDAGHANIAFDCAVWNTLDVHALLARAAPEQLVYGSDAPYYRAATCQAKLLLALDAAGAHAHLPAVLWGTAERIAAGRPDGDLSPPLGRPRVDMSYERLRAHEYLVVSVPMIWTNQPDHLGALQLARNALAGEPGDAVAAATALIALAESCWAAELRSGDRAEILSLSWRTFRLLELADALLLTGR
jgi:hypothetical protein